MILENLFAQAAQGRTFLLMCVCGLPLGAMLHLSRALRGWKPWLGAVADAAAAILLAGMVLGVMLGSGEGLRGYALLGLLLGTALYTAGLSHVMTGLGRLMRRPAHFILQKTKAKEGNEAPADESFM